ncbi:MAG: hypothetical protein WAJ87_02355, partial [Bryobacteraceae bacterium]
TQNRRRIVEPGGGYGQVVMAYLVIRQARSPDSFFQDSIFTPCFLPAVEMNPRTLCACHPAAAMISGRVAPFARPIISRIWAPLLCVRPALAAFLPALALRPLAPVAVFWLLGALFLRLATFFELALSGATVAPGAAAVAAVSLVSAFIMVFAFPFWLPSGAPD